MANRLRAYLSFGADGSFNYTGRFTLTVDPFTYPGGTDGRWFEFDAIVDDPDDSTKVWLAYIGVNTSLPSSAITAGFTFDSASPPAWVDWWGMYRTNKVGGYTGSGFYPDALVWDGTWTDFDTGFAVTTDPASAANWWKQPASATPTITAPAGGSSYMPSDDLLVTVTWTEPGTEIDSEVVTSGAFTSDSGSQGVVNTYGVLIPYGTSGTVTIGVRAKQTGHDWSPYATVTITVTADVDTPVACFDDEILLDSPDTFWLPRETTGSGTADLSGNGHHGWLTIPDPFGSTLNATSKGTNSSLANGGTLTVTPPTSAVADDTIYVGFADFMSPSAGTPGALVLGLPAGWTLEHQENDTTSFGGGQRASYVVASHVFVAGETSYAFTLTAANTSTHEVSWVAGRWHNLSASIAAVGVHNHSTTSLAPPAYTPDVQQRTEAVYFGMAAGAGSGVSAPVGVDTRDTESTGDTQVTMGDVLIDVTGPPAGSYTGGGSMCIIVVAATVTTAEPYETWGLDNGICDGGCVDVNYALRFDLDDLFPSVFRNDGVAPLVGLTAFAVEGFFYVSPTAELPGGGTFDWIDALFFQLTANTIGQVTVEYAGALSASAPKSKGCWQHLALLYDSTNPNPLRVLLNGVVVGRGTPGAPPNSSLINIRERGNPDGRLGYFAVYAAALTQKRVKAHFSHLCHICRAGMGFVLGTTTFS